MKTPAVESEAKYASSSEEEDYVSTEPDDSDDEDYVAPLYVRFLCCPITVSVS